MSIHELQAALRALDEARRKAAVVEPLGGSALIMRDAWISSLFGAAWEELEQAVRAHLDTPPSADALVEALGKLSTEWRGYMNTKTDYDAGRSSARESCADALDAALAAHKENTDGR